jgi:hypothetical protein
MSLRLAFGAIVAPAMHRALARGERAVLRSVAIALAFTVGAALLLVSALLALSAWIGPIAATGIGGLILLMAGSIAALVWRSRFSRRSGPPDMPAGDMRTNGPMLLGGISLVVGFALIRLLLRKKQ